MTVPVSNVAKLALVESPSVDTVAEFDKLAKAHREEIEKHGGDCGFVIITYWRPSLKSMSSRADYILNDPMDAYALPGFVAERIRDITNNN